ncbi:MAG: hypothetical protein MGG11_20740 [Trichodesmium sp. MAG_R03]|nr:hypothetical protein [Trichodesmium sp. MAG_R03]
MKKFSTLLGSLCALVVANLPLSALAIPSDFDYKSTPEEYHTLPDLSIPYRTLPRKFDFPIITEIDVDNNISTDNLITDAFVNNLPSIPTGITLNELLRYRAEYTARIEAWGEEVTECLNQKPQLFRVSTSSPVIINGVEGLIVLNTNNRAICK